MFMKQRIKQNIKHTSIIGWIIVTILQIAIAILIFVFRGKNDLAYFISPLIILLSIAYLIIQIRRTMQKPKNKSEDGTDITESSSTS
jgi:FtsH-binding integral membrane protein